MRRGQGPPKGSAQKMKINGYNQPSEKNAEGEFDRSKQEAGKGAPEK